MGSSLPRLIAISQDPELRTHVRTIEVQDDCAINDPYNTSHPLRSSEIWPRDTNGHVLTQQIGVKTLRDILTEGSLCPENILMRDYRIASVNFAVCPETARTVDYRIHLKTSTTPEPAAALAKEIVSNLNLPITSIEMRAADHVPPSKDSMLFEWARQTNEPCALGSPEIWDVCLRLLPSYKGSIAAAGPFSRLQSAELNVATYWLEQISYHAVGLKRLQFRGSSSWDILPHPYRTCPFRLTTLTISRAAIHADMILSVLANSSDTLTELCFEWVHLKEGNTWANLLPSIADRFPNLTIINIRYLWNGEARTGNSNIICFDPDEFDDEWRSILTLHEKKRLGLERVVGISYQGPHVARVLRDMALHSKALKHLFEVA